MNAIAAERKVPFYSVSLRFYGPQPVIRAQWDYAKKRLSSIAGIQFEDGATYDFPLTDEQLPSVHSEREVGVPSLSIFSIGTRSNFGPGNSGHVGFSPAIPMTGEAIIESQRVIETVLQDYADELGGPVGSSVFPQTYHARTLVILVLFSVGAIPRSIAGHARCSGTSSRSPPIMAGASTAPTLPSWTLAPMRTRSMTTPCSSSSRR